MIDGHCKGNFGRSFNRIGSLVLAAMLATILLSGFVACGGGGAPEGDSLSKQYIDALNILDPYNRVTALLRVARQQEKAKDGPGAEKSLASANLACQEITETLQQTQAYAILALAQAELGSEDAAKNSIKEVRRLLADITDLERIVQIRTNVALAQAKHLRQVDSAKFELREAEKAVESITGTVGRANSYRLLAATCHELDMSDEATRLIGLARTTADEAEDSKAQAESLAGIALTYSRWQDTAQADAVFSEALTLANAIEDPWQRSYAQISVAKALRSAGKNEQFVTVLDAAEVSADHVADSQMRDPLYLDISKLRP